MYILYILVDKHVHIVVNMYIFMNNHIYSTLFKIQERKSDRRSREIEQRKESQNTHTHKTRTCELNLLH